MRLDHLVLAVGSVGVTCDFYARMLGMDVVTFEEGRRALLFGSQKINLQEAGKEFEPKARVPTRGSADLCFITETPIAEVIAHLRTQGVEIELGPVPRVDAISGLESVYFCDPDGNLSEVANLLSHNTATE